MSVDPPTYQGPACSSASPNILIKASQLRLKNEREKNIYKKLKKKEFTHTPMLDSELLQEAGMDSELDLIFALVGWGSFWNITEQGSKVLTIEFLCTLQTTTTRITFRLFDKNFLYAGETLVPS
jgi:hypothetical protein